MKLRYAAIVLGMMSVGAYANTVNYTVTSPGTIVNCKARPSGVGLCRKVSPSMLLGSTGVYDTNDGLFQLNIPGEPAIGIQFSGNHASESVCTEIHNPLIIEPSSYCQINAHYYALLAMSANYNPSQVIVADTNVTENIGGFMTVTFTLKGTTFSPK